LIVALCYYHVETQGLKEEDLDYPDVDDLIGHEVGNIIAKVPVGYPEKEGEDRLWEDNSEAIAAFEKYKDSLDKGDLRSRAEAYRELESFDSPSTPERSRKIIQQTLDVINSAEAYEKILEGRYNYSVSESNSIGLGDALTPLDWCHELNRCEGLEAEYDEDIEVVGDESLRIVPNTIIKNWLEHGGGREPDTSLQVESEDSGEEVSIFAYDDGPGYEGDPEDLFEYSQEDESGIGLPTAARILEEFGGDIDYFEPDTGGMGYEITLKQAQ
jgi:hypothetical protein